MKALIVDDYFVEVARKVAGEEEIPYPSRVEIAKTPLASLEEAQELVADIRVPRVREDAQALLDAAKTPQSFWDAVIRDARLKYEAFDVLVSRRTPKEAADRCWRLQTLALTGQLLSMLESPQPGYRSLTEPYRAAGMSAFDEVLVLGEPKLPLNNNHFYNNPLAHDLATAYFDVERAVSLVERAEADVVVVDIGFPAAVPAALLARYREAAASRGLENTGKALERAGGVLLGRALADRRIPFAFWTLDYHHAQHGLEAAGIFDLVDPEEIRTLKAVAESEDLTDRIYTSESGKLIVANKWLGNRDSELRDTLDFTRERMESFEGVLIHAHNYVIAQPTL